ncbi:MAG TPA: phosphate ABC transporter permease PstA [candidate division WOR-3 bacterium]|uniref:Phosphate transport system permease protein PstA n=1 Tax=candidate division WOR-3 bacterium TaxID=2052148 RepID=A0A7C5HJY8_UNCW3|nr:phosphate ABC transporter permease PstA [candidate division WOR-3 bacterium]
MKNLKFRIMIDKFFIILIAILTFAIIVPLFAILFYVVKQGVSVINWEFFVSLPAPIGVKGGGISNAIVGTLILIFLSAIISIPLGITAGIFLSEYNSSRLSNYVRLSTEILQGIPSIVMGIIAYIWIVKPIGRFSALSGAVALGIMMLPLVVKSTEENLRLIPQSLREASLALGVPYYRTILKVVLPASLSGILTGILIGIARVAGETAPLLFTAFGSPYMNVNILKPINSLPLLIFNYASSPYHEWQRIAWGASFVLIVFVLILSLMTKGLTRKWKTEF